ncbi:hypothetical protein DPMN_169997 [Dreissena polymorpha]|uniref:Uncharacterized protein n=1 Tax=Dreissena polymorpha TaxID=45954 RepID=A0A9D4DYG7_DREPO|nr:hypothetical protein DPMN_169997 [Dreissena polymorpha]
MQVYNHSSTSHRSDCTYHIIVFQCLSLESWTFTMRSDRSAASLYHYLWLLELSLANSITTLTKVWPSKLYLR